MSTEKKEPLFYSKGYSVFQRPNKGQMGFKVCDCDEYVDGAAELIAACLNFVNDLAEQPNKLCDARLAILIDEARKLMKEEA